MTTVQLKLQRKWRLEVLERVHAEWIRIEQQERYREALETLRYLA